MRASTRSSSTCCDPARHQRAHILVAKRAVPPVASSAIIAAGNTGQLAVSATSAWEVGLLATRTGITRLVFEGDARRWFAKVVAGARLRVLPLDETIALEAVYLPGDLHRDPSDRWVVATARVMDATLVTSDRRILTYAALGYVKALRL